MNYCKNDVFRFVEVNDANGSTKDLSTYKAASVFMRMYPDCNLSLATLRTYIMRFRNGEAYTHIPHFDPDSIVDAIESNRGKAISAFNPKPINNTIQPDLDPLGMGGDDETDINKIFFDIPETYASHTLPNIITGVNYIGIASDIHFPLHNRQALLACFAKLKELNIEGLYLNGDIMDCASVGHHAKRSVLNYTWDQELMVAKAFFKSLRVLFPDIPIWYKMGNHEDWLPRYLARVAPEIGNEYGLAKALDLDYYNIKVVDSHQVSCFGKLWIAHGHEIGLKGGTLNIARQVLMRTNVNTICGHWHKNDQHERRNLDESVVSSWVTGCLSDLHPDYAPANQMTHGFATVKLLDDDGAFVVHPYKIVHGRVIG